MPAVCSAFNCTNCSDKTTNISFYKFPLKDKEITERWVINMKRENWFPTTASYLCSAHFEEKYMYHTNVQRRLLSKPVPNIFNFPPHLQKQDKVLRPQPRKRSFDNLQDSAITVTSLAQMPVGPTSVSAHRNYCLPSPKKLKTQYNRVQAENVRLKKRIKQMKQLSVRHKRRIVQLQTLVAGLRRRLCSSVSDMLNSEHVVGLLKKLLELQCSAKVCHYSQLIRKFALTLHFYSAKAYSYLRKFVKLPHPRTLRLCY
ncbi:THAP domain-containing protein 2-like [Schistocerca piceifrons]|uniref:THAP domain-containing protein 2-like n=1 Tax=Schistocerca piceifrons TaxID=274613 RepID=UPI001F5F206C|nr:THAP domain-containing protein 2-like [Schistocerca piceifrons]